MEKEYRMGDGRKTENVNDVTGCTTTKRKGTSRGLYRIVQGGRLNDDQYFEDAFYIWNFRHNRHGEISDYVEHFMKVPIVDPNVLGQMLRLSREAQQLTLNEVAKRLRIHQSTLTRIEKSESQGNIKINTLERVAEAIDCELVYCLRPKSRITFARATWTLVCPILAENSKFWSRDISINEFAITVKRLLEHPHFRKKMKWNQRGPVSDGGVIRMILKQATQRLIPNK